MEFRYPIFSGFLNSNYVNWKIYCDDHSGAYLGEGCSDVIP